MLDVLCPLITEADYISNDLLDIILIHIVEPNKSQKKNASNLARDLVTKTSDTLEPYIQQVSFSSLRQGFSEHFVNEPSTLLFQIMFLSSIIYVK